MQFIALDENFNVITPLAPTLVLWNRKYYECGDFTIEILHEQYDNSMKYIYTKYRPEIGMIQKIVYDGEKVTMKGYFLNKILDDKIIYPTFYGSGEITQQIIEMVKKNKEDIRIDRYHPLNGEKIDFQATGDELSSKIYSILATQEMSYNLSYDFEEDKFDLIFFKGDDKTVGDDIVTFSKSYNNLIEPILNEDETNYKNFALVAGMGQKEERVTVEVDLSEGKHKKQLFVDARDMQQDKQTIEQYKLELAQRGFEALAEKNIINEVSFKIIGQGYEYLKDYDLGYKVYAIIKDINKEYIVRITAIYEVFKEGTQEIEIEIGNVKVKGAK